METGKTVCTVIARPLIEEAMFYQVLSQSKPSGIQLFAESGFISNAIYSTAAHSVDVKGVITKCKLLSQNAANVDYQPSGIIPIINLYP